jgi:hypothetical protein
MGRILLDLNRTTNMKKAFGFERNENCNSVVREAAVYVFGGLVEIHVGHMGSNDELHRGGLVRACVGLDG